MAVKGGETMNKSELTAELAKKAGLTLKDARLAINALFSTAPREGIIATEVARGQRVQITGFGTFDSRKRAKRQGRNPRTGAPITIAGGSYPVFVAGKTLKERIRR
jgi:DNA-binding protein HU-beta